MTTFDKMLVRYHIIDSRITCELRKEHIDHNYVRSLKAERTGLTAAIDAWSRFPPLT